MTDKEKAKRYDEVLKVIKECNPDENGFITIYPQEIFPELKESEDEKIRKELINYFTKGMEYLSLCSFDKESILAWLESIKNKSYT